MKEFLKVFAIMFVALFALHYFFGGVGDMPRMLFVSGFTALGIALVDKFVKGRMINLIKKITERYS